MLARAWVATIYGRKTRVLGYGGMYVVFPDDGCRWCEFMNEGAGDDGTTKNGRPRWAISLVDLNMGYPQGHYRVA